MNERLSSLRIKRGLTQKQVAEQLGLSTRAYSHYEVGDRDPSIEIFKAMCDFFDVSADYLIGRSDEY